MRTFILGSTLATLMVLCPYVAMGQCTSDWTFSDRFGYSSVTGTITKMLALDDGNGPAIYARQVTTFAGTAAPGLARWNGKNWSLVGSGLTGTVTDMVSFNPDGTGDKLFVAGNLTSANGVSKPILAAWNGSAWSAIGANFQGTISSMGVFNDGINSALYVSGSFTSIGGTSAQNIAKWDGQSWSAMGSGLGGGNALDMQPVMTESGPALVVAGGFTSAGGMAVGRIAMWRDSAWSTLGAGLNATVRALAVMDSGTGPELYAGGVFSTAGGVPAANLARWNGSTWSSVGQGVDSSVNALQVFNDGTGDALYVGGSFIAASGVSSWYVVKWTGLEFQLSGIGLSGEVSSLVAYDDLDGPRLYAGGSFERPYSRFAKLVGTKWVGAGLGIDDVAFTMTTWDDGRGKALFVGGDFEQAGETILNGIGRWDGESWEPLSEGVDGFVYDLGVARLSVNGPSRLYAAGQFTRAGPEFATNIAQWDGANWSTLGEGVDGDAMAVAEYDDGNGPALYVGGGFSHAGGGMLVNKIAKWDGQAWSSLGTGMSGGSVECLATYSGPDGTELYAGGTFTAASGVIARGIARWNGVTWRSVGTDPVGSSPQIRAFAVHNDGSGPRLFAAGNFTNALGWKNIAAWNGTSWSSVALLNSTVTDLLVWNDGVTGPRLYAATSPSAGVNCIARMGDAAWESLSTGLTVDTESPYTGPVAYCLAEFDHPSQSALYVGGAFWRAGGHTSHCLARWTGPERPVIVDQPDDRSVPLGQSASFSVGATGNGTLTYSWRRNGVPVFNGPNVTGAFTSTITILSVGSNNLGSYRVTVGNGCTSTVSNPAVLAQAPPCPADVNGTHGVDIDDLVVIITQWRSAGGPADINHDNVVNIDDLVQVITHWGSCP